MRLICISALGAAALCFAVTSCGETTYDLSAEDQSALGAEFVARRDCARCHQSSNRADGVLSGSAVPVTGSAAYAPNLTPDHSTGIGDWADIQIVRAMRAGLDHESAQLCPTMPRYDGSGDAGIPPMTDLEAYAIASYLRHLPAIQRAVPESICPPLKEPPDLGAPDG